MLFLCHLLNAYLTISQIVQKNNPGLAGVIFIYLLKTINSSSMSFPLSCSWHGLQQFCCLQPVWFRHNRLS
jgi:hypothetical protein